jgi:hypothetical protein
LKVSLPEGVEVNFRSDDRDGRPWFFDVLQMTSPADQRKLHAYVHGAQPEGA